MRGQGMVAVAHDQPLVQEHRERLGRGDRVVPLVGGDRVLGVDEPEEAQ